MGGINTTVISLVCFLLLSILVPLYLYLLHSSNTFITVTPVLPTFDVFFITVITSYSRYFWFIFLSSLLPVRIFNISSIPFIAIYTSQNIQQFKISESITNDHCSRSPTDQILINKQ